MTTTELITPPASPRPTAHERTETPNVRPSDCELPPLQERLGEILPLICVVPVAGPPVIFLIVPWLLFTLMLTGPFLLLVTFVLAAVILVAFTAAILAPPYLLLRYVRKHRTRERGRHTPGRRPDELHPIGVSLLAQRSTARLMGGPRGSTTTEMHLHNTALTQLKSEGR